MEAVWPALVKIGTLAVSQVPYAIGLAIFFTLASQFSAQACSPSRPWWKSRDLVTDTHYFFLLPIISSYLNSILAVMLILMFWGQPSDDILTGYLQNGHGPLSTLSLPVQAVIYILGSDFLLYWCHRLFHLEKLWPFHAVHHSAEDVDWTTAYRAHPVDNMFRFGLVRAIMIVMGISPEVSLMLIPFDIISAAFVHSNLNWTLGPLKYVIATPVFHRWHHTAPDEGGEMNFSPTLSIWDVLFGTFYMPPDTLPQEFGVDDPEFPKDFLGQMVTPFRTFIKNMKKPAS